MLLGAAVGATTGLVGEAEVVTVGWVGLVGVVAGVFLVEFLSGLALLVFGFLALPVFEGVSTLLLFLGSGLFAGVSVFLLPPSDDFRRLSGFCEISGI